MNEGDMMDAAGVVTVGRVGFTEMFRCIFGCQAPLKHGVLMTTSPYWEQSLTRVVQQALSLSPKYILFFDGDGAWEMRDLRDLYKVIESDETIDAVFPVQADRNGPRPLVWNWLPDHFGPYDFSQPLINYPHGHFGLTLIRAQVFRELTQPWFLSQPANDGTWELKPGKMDADTYFWMRLHEHQKKTEHRCVLATQTVVGHMELMIRWQHGSEVTCQMIPEFQRDGKPYGLRAPRVDEVDGSDARDAASSNGKKQEQAPDPIPEPEEALA